MTEGHQLAHQARQRADPIDDTMTGSTVAWFGGVNYRRLRAPREAQDWYTHELAKPRTARSANRRVILHNQLASACREMGELTKARTYLAKVNAENKLEGLPQFADQARLLFYEGQWELADKSLTAHVEQLRTSGHLLDEFYVALELARLHTFKRELGKAVQLLQRELHIPVDGGDILQELLARSLLATLAADAGDALQALPHLQRCRQLVAAGENWLGVAGFVDLAEAVVVAAQGEYSAAEAHFEEAITTFQRYCRPWDEADTLQYWGRALLAAGEHARAIEKFDAAIEIYRSRGAGTRFIEYVMADKVRAQGSASARAEVQPSPPVSVNSNAPAGTHQLETAPPSPTVWSEHTHAHTDAGSVLRHEGDYWTVSYEGQTWRLKDAKGLHYIAYLLGHPGEEIRVLDLVSRVGGRREEVADRAGAEDLARSGALVGDLGHAGE
ncbi:MAG TPA: hypothetical protein VEV37_03510, partial [Bryobacteraceae bacterium]|nr:hypothetical protein [Bryobacteraceae bacterium]